MAGLRAIPRTRGAGENTSGIQGKRRQTRITESLNSCVRYEAPKVRIPAREPHARASYSSKAYEPREKNSASPQTCPSKTARLFLQSSYAISYMLIDASPRQPCRVGRLFFFILILFHSGLLVSGCVVLYWIPRQLLFWKISLFYVSALCYLP